VLAARAEELFKVVADIIKEKELSHLVIGGVVLTGGGALVKGLPELAEYIFERPAKLGLPKSIGGMSNVMQSPKYATALGLLMESQENEVFEEETHSKVSHRDDAISKLGRSLKNAFKEIF
jgi:cell division protein FtsA